MQFADITGLDDVKSVLIDAARKNHLAHAQLFNGPAGSAKLALALALITYINCENREESDSCGTCASCQKNSKFIHPDVHFIFPVSSTPKVPAKDAVSNSFLKEWRQFLASDPYGTVNDWSLTFGGENKQLNISKAESKSIIQKLSLKAFEGGYKVILIWLPEHMNASAANGILKVLEEPADRTLFFLVTEDQERLLSTILSRTQKVPIRAFHKEEIASQLHHQGIDKEKATRLSHMAGGNLKLAMQLTQEQVTDSDHNFKEWMRVCYGGDYGKLVNWAEDFHKLPKLSQQGFFRFGNSLLRETLLNHYGSSGLMRIPEEEKQFIKKFSQVVTSDKIEPLMQLFNEASFHLERNASPKMVFLDLSITVSRVLKNQANGVTH